MMESIMGKVSRAYVATIKIELQKQKLELKSNG